MKRKVIQLAGKTLVVSLPSKWAKKYGVKKGDEMDVDEEEKRIIFKAYSKAEVKKKALDATGLNIMLNRTIGGLYKAGYDEIEVNYTSPDQYAIIRDVLNKTCMGYEIVRQGQKTLLIKNLSDLHSQEFDNLLRRLFLTLLSSVDDALDYLRQGNIEGMNEIIARDLTINKYSDLCRRILNIQGYENTKMTTTYYYICEELEKVGDAYRDLMRYLVENKVNKLDKETLSLISDLNSYLRLFYELFYQFELNKLEEFGRLTAKFKKEFIARLSVSSVKELRINYQLHRIFSMIFDMNGSLITANI